MIKIYLLLLILVFLFISVLIKEPFQVQPGLQVQSSESPNDVCEPKQILNRHSSITLTGIGTYKDSTPKVDLHWTHPTGLSDDSEKIKHYIILKNHNNDFDFINEITDNKVYNSDNQKYTYTLKDNLETGLLYSISINVLDTENSAMYSSNTLNVKPQPEVMNDEEVSKDIINSSLPEKLLNTLKNKTFDIYL